MAELLTLVVDCGGLGIKAGVVDAGGNLVGDSIRVPTPYPFSPADLVELIAGFVRDYPQVERVSVGMPGMIRHGVVVYTPHYITKNGPFTEINSELKKQWAGFAIQTALVQRINKPVRVLNDAELHGYGVIKGEGLELVLTLGTGLGTAWYDNGVLAPHLEISHAPIRIGTAQPGAERKETITFDRYIGDAELKQLGAGHWSERVYAAIESLRPVFLWDKLYLGGGNAANIAPYILKAFSEDIEIVPNESALIGGAMLWNRS